MSETILFRIITPQGVTQDINDDLLTFPDGDLEFFSYPIRFHSHRAELQNTEEEVVGFQPMTCFELTLTPEQRLNLINYLKSKSYAHTLTFQQLQFHNFDDQ